MKRSLFIAACLVLLGAGCQGGTTVAPATTEAPATAKTSAAPAKNTSQPASAAASVTIGGEATK